MIFCPSLLNHTHFRMCLIMHLNLLQLMECFHLKLLLWWIRCNHLWFWLRLLCLNFLLELFFLSSILICCCDRPFCLLGSFHHGCCLFVSLYIDRQLVVQFSPPFELHFVVVFLVHWSVRSWCCTLSLQPVGLMCCWSDFWLHSLPFSIRLPFFYCWFLLFPRNLFSSHSKIYQFIFVFIFTHISFNLTLWQATMCSFGFDFAFIFL